MNKYRKYFVALATAVAVAASEGVLDSSAATIILAVLGALGVYAVPNASQDPSA